MDATGGRWREYKIHKDAPSQSPSYIYLSCMLNRNFCIIKFDGASQTDQSVLAGCVLPDLESVAVLISHSNKSACTIRPVSIFLYPFLSSLSVRSLYCRSTLLKTPPLLAFFTFRKLHICTCIYIHGHHHPVAAKCIQTFNGPCL